MKFETKYLTDVVFFQEGPGVRKFQFRDKGVKLLNVGNINNGVLDTSTTKLYVSEEEAFGKYKHFLVDDGDLLIASSGIVVSNFHNKIAYVRKEHLPLCLNTSTIRFKTLNNKTFHLDYLKYYLKTNHFKNQLKKLITGAAQLNFGPSHLKKITIPVPSLDEQVHISNVLTKAENLIAQRKESMRLLDEFLKSTFLDMFGDPGINPKKWPIKKIEDYIEYMGDIGSNGSNEMVAKNLEMLDEEDYAIMVRTTNLTRNDFTHNVKYVTKKTYDFFKKSKIYGGEIIMNKIGSAGDFWLMPHLNKPVSLGLNQLVIRTKDIPTLYLYYYLSTDYGRMIVKAQAKGATTKSITKTAVKALPLMYPPIELQNQFVSVVEKTNALKSQYQQSLQELENLYGSLSQRAFKGELEMKKALKTN